MSAGQKRYRLPGGFVSLFILLDRVYKWVLRRNRLIRTAEHIKAHILIRI